MNIAIFASGRGTNFEALVKAQRKGVFKADIKILITDNKSAYVRRRARRLGIKEEVVEFEKFKDRKSFEKEILKILKREKIDLILLAGFMRILSPYFVKKYKNRILNIHPALLPSFKGTQAIKRAFKYGVKVTGVTVHFVNEKVDSGPIILQEPVKITQKDTLESLERKIHRVEHKLYPKAVKLFVEGKLKIEGRRVKIAE